MNRNTEQAEITENKDKRLTDKFFKRMTRKCRLAKTLIEQNNNHSRIIRKTQFRTPLKVIIKANNSNICCLLLSDDIYVY